MTGSIIALVVYDIERPDGAIADTTKLIGSKVRTIKSTITERLGLSSEATSGGASISFLGATVVSTGLIGLNISRYALSGIPRCPNEINTAGAIEVDGDGLLLGHCSGRFFRLTLGPKPAIKYTGFVVPMFWDELVAYLPNTATQDTPSITLLDLLVLQNGKTAVSYTRWNDPKKCFQFSVAVVDLRTEPPALEIIFEAEPCMEPYKNSDLVFDGLQAGGRLIQTSNKALLVTVGDFDRYGGVNQIEGSVQDPKNDIGKIVEINLETGEHPHVSMGHRNGQGLALMKDGRIFETEHGPQGGDELNLIRYGAHYGWPFDTLGVAYGGGDWFLARKRGDHSQYQTPIFAFMPSIGVSQLMESRGFAQEWEGDLLVGSLKEQTLHRLRIGSNSVLYDEPILLNQRLRDMVQIPGRRIAILTDDYEIVVLEEDRESRIQSIMAAASKPAREVMQRCLMCHVWGTKDTTGGKIPLTGIIGRKAASLPGVKYSDGLKAVKEVWTPDSLEAFIADPERMAPGTPMASKAVRDPQVRRELVELIGKLSTP